MRIGIGQESRFPSARGSWQSRRIRSRWFAPSRHVPVLGMVVGVIAAIGMATAPSWLREQLVIETGIGHYIPAANPPLGMTARVAMTLVAGILATAITWAGLKLLFAPVRPKTARIAEAKPVPRYEGQPVSRQIRREQNKDAVPVWAGLLSLLRGRTGASDEDIDADALDTVAVPARRRPILASAELGDPLDMFDPARHRSVVGEGVTEKVEAEPVPAQDAEPVSPPAETMCEEASHSSGESELPQVLTATIATSRTDVTDATLTALVDRLEHNLPVHVPVPLPIIPPPVEVDIVTHGRFLPNRFVEVPTRQSRISH